MNEKQVAILGLAVVSASLMGAYLTMPLDRFLSLLVAATAFFAGLTFPWALLYVMLKLEEEERKERPSSRPQSCVSPN